MAVILLLESSTTNCSVGLSKDGQLIELREANEGYTHSEHMASFVKEVMSESKVNFSDLDAVAVGKGPGSYTGLRIGVSLAKGFAYAQEIPLISLESLEVTAAACLDQTSPGDLIIPMTDARRMEVYTAIYDHQLNRLSEIEARLLDEHSFSSELENHSCYFCGDGSSKFKSLATHTNAKFVESVYPSAQNMAALAEAKFSGGVFENTAYFEPYYLKEFIAIKPKKLF